jgi:RNA polymerase sigma-70 factor (ECF subfamily)
VLRAAVELLGAEPVIEADPRLEFLRAGDASAVQEVLIELMPRVRSWLFRRLGPDIALDDATQEALTEIALSLTAYQGRSSLAAYAYRICARVAARYVQQSRKNRLHCGGSAATSFGAVDVRDPENQAINRETLRSIYRCLNKLPSKRREAFILCEFEGMSTIEAAVLVGTTANAMRIRLMYARDEMARLLKASDIAYRGQKGELLP